MFQITILFLYVGAACAFAMSRLPRNAARAQLLAGGGFALGILAVVLHAQLTYTALIAGNSVAATAAISLIGLQLGAIALLGALVQNLRGFSAGLLLLAAFMALAAGPAHIADTGTVLTWQMRTHILTSLFAYGLLTVGAIVAVFGLVQLRRLKSARLSAANQLFAPLETTESLLFAITIAGFAVLALAVISGFTFVEDLFAQHLVHKTILSLLALVVFGVLLVGRHFAGWRGRRALYLYLVGFGILCLAYFGSRFILEQVLGRSWS